ncbi:MAG: TonB-dependent receptor plug domain-containing protein [Acidobacteria bacterium]|nr:TonB-dependent receptor plug domain-containing protein [Acidobacteriota bacterium]
MYRLSSRLRMWGACALLAALPVAAQESSRLSGTIARPDGTPVAGVAVLLSEPDLLAISDRDGEFFFSDLGPGPYRLMFTLGPHSEVVDDVAVVAGQDREVEVVVEWPLNVAETVIVEGASRRPERIVEAPAAVSLADAVEVELQAVAGQLPRALVRAPGAEVVQADVYDFSFNTRGFNDMVNRRVLMTIDGRDPSLPGVGTQEWASFSFPFDDIEALEIVRGAGSALYGRGAYNGVVSMTTRQPRSNTGMVRMGGGELSTFRTDGLISRDLGDGWFLKLTAGGSGGDDFTVSRTDSVEYAPGQLPMDAVAPPLDRVKSLYGGVRLDRTTSGGHSMTIEGGAASVEGATTMTGLGRVQQTDSLRPWGRFNMGTERWNLMAFYTGQDSNDIVPLSSGARLFWNTYNIATELQGNTTVAGGRGRLVGGVSAGRERLDSADRDGVQTQLAQPQTASRVGVFGQIDYDFSRQLKGVATVRWDYSTVFDPRISPRVALVYSPHPLHTLRASFNEAFLGPSMVQQFLLVPAASPIDLSGIEEALQPVLGGGGGALGPRQNPGPRGGQRESGGGAGPDLRVGLSRGPGTPLVRESDLLPESAQRLHDQPTSPGWHQPGAAESRLRGLCAAR